jgi:hypothetical protein
MHRIVIAGLLAASVLGGACASRPDATIHDAAYVRRANALCKDQLPDLRAKKEKTDVFGRTSKTDRADTAAKVEKAADGLDKLAEELGALPLRSQDQPEVAAWLEEWANYTGTGRRYAAALRTERDSVITSIAREAEPSVHNIAHFARANKIDECVL